MKLFLGMLFFSLGANAQVIDQACQNNMDALFTSSKVSNCVRKKLDEHIGMLEIPVTIKLSTNGKILSIDELRAHLMTATGVLANPSSQSSIYAAIQVPGLSNLRLMNDRGVANGFYVSLVAVSLSYVQQVRENTFFHVRYLVDISTPFSKIIHDDILFDTDAYEKFKEVHCPSCISSKLGGLRSNWSAPNMAMEVAFNIKNFKIAVDGRVSYFSREVVRDGGSSGETWATSSGNQKTLGLEVSKKFKFNRGLKFEIYGRAEMNQMKNTEKLSYYYRKPFHVSAATATEKTTSYATQPYFGAGIRFSLNHHFKERLQ